MHWLTAYPFATVSSAAFYLLLLSLVFPRTRAFAVPLFTHPIPPTQEYLRGFDSLRGIAASGVAISHCWWATYPVFAYSQSAALFLAYGTKWVSIFAVLSGFLIYRSGLSAIKSVVSIRIYIIRRFFRVYPVYLLGVLLCLLLGQYQSNPNLNPVAYFFSDLFMFPTVSWPGGFANPPTWSLYVEVAFYAALPLALIVAGQRRIVALCSIILLAMILADDQSRVFTLWRYFLFGILASELSPRLPRRVAIVCAAVGTVLIVLDFGGPRLDWAAKLGIGVKHPDVQTLGLGLGMGLLLAGLPHLPRIGRLLSWPPLQMLGVISYSVYITHFFYIKANFPEIEFFTRLGTQEMTDVFRTHPQFAALYLPLVFFPGALFWGAVSFLLVERPGMMLGKVIASRGKRLQEFDVSSGLRGEIV